MASDTWLDNEASIRAHVKMGYVEVERLVHFVKKLVISKKPKSNWMIDCHISLVIVLQSALNDWIICV